MPKIPRTPNTVEGLEREIDRLTAEIEPLAERRGHLMHARLCLKSPFLINDVIEWDTGTEVWKKRRTFRGRVARIIPWAGGDPQWVVHVLLSNGRESAAETVVHPYWKPVLIVNPCPTCKHAYN